jgi:UDP-3-O-[3-hydroxymyristoyl] glucosamine N-acyltransferase
MTRPDPRFYEALGPVSLGALAELTGARVDASAADIPIEAAGVLARADAASVAFFSDRRHADAAAATAAGACFVAEKDKAQLPTGCMALVTPAPQTAWAIAAGRLHRGKRLDPADPPRHPSALIEDDVSIGHGVVIGAGVQIGSGAELGPYAVIGPGVAIGRGTRIGAGAVIGFALIGDGVSIGPGVVIGEAGFGVTAGPKGLMDVPQHGRVIIQDNVGIGPHTCVDRGTHEDTVIGENTKIDNQVQIAHNVVIGRNCVIAAHSGLSGSSAMGDWVQMGGSVGVADHVTIGSRARVAALAGVMRDVPAGESWCGIPAVPVLQFFRQVAWLQKAAARRNREGEA